MLAGDERREIGSFMHENTSSWRTGCFVISGDKWNDGDTEVSRLLVVTSIGDFGLVVQ